VAWRVGAQVAGYLLEGELGAGGMGTVYRARDLRSGALRALKATPVGLDPEQVLRFQREGEALARAGGHPHVLRVHSAGQAEGRAFLVTDLAEGGSLAERLQEGPLPVEEAVELVAVLADALAHLHARGVVHRDLKPENVLFSAEGRVLLADFGLATLPDARSLTASGVILGTPAYMAPEQALGSSARDPQSDVYGLGAVLYACLLGRPPFAGGSTLAILDQVVNQEPRPARRERREVPRWLDALLRQALAKDPQRRPASAAALAEALCAGEAGDSGSGAGPWIAAALALLLLAVGGLAFARRSEAPPPPSASPRSRPSTRPSPPRPTPASSGRALTLRSWLGPAQPHEWERGRAGLVVLRSGPEGPLDVFAWFETTGHLYRWRAGRPAELIDPPTDLPSRFGPKGRHWTGFMPSGEGLLAVVRGPAGLLSLSRHDGRFESLPNSLILDHRQPTALTHGTGESALVAFGSGPEVARRSDLTRVQLDGRQKELVWRPTETTHYVIRLAEAEGWIAAVLELGPSSQPSGYEVVLRDPASPRELVSVARYPVKPRCLALLARRGRAPLLLWAGSERDAQALACDAPQRRLRIPLSHQGSELAWDEVRTPRFLTRAGQDQVLLGAGRIGVPESSRLWLLARDPKGESLEERWTRGFERTLAAARIVEGYLVALAHDGSLWIERAPR